MDALTGTELGSISSLDSSRDSLVCEGEGKLADVSPVLLPLSLGQMVKETLRGASEFLLAGLEPDDACYWARRGDAQEVVELVGSEGAALSRALLVAAKHGQFDCVQTLLDHASHAGEGGGFIFWQQLVGYLLGHIRTTPQLSDAKLSLGVNLAVKALDAIEVEQLSDDDSSGEDELLTIKADCLNALVLLKEKQTLFHLMAKFCDGKQVSNALDAGARPLLLDRQGRQAFDIAQISGNESALAALQDYALAHELSELAQDSEFAYINQSNGKIPSDGKPLVRWHKEVDGFIGVDLD